MYQPCAMSLLQTERRSMTANSLQVLSIVCFLIGSLGGSLRGGESIRLASDSFIKASNELVQDLERVLGSGQVQLCGVGTKRQKQLAQQKLFSEEAQGAAQTEALTVELTEEESGDEQ